MPKRHLAARPLPVANARALAAMPHERAVPMLAAHKGFTRTRQAIADVRGFGGETAAFRLTEANVSTNKNLIPADRPEDWNRPSGLRLGTTEVTRWGMTETEMVRITGLIVDGLEQRRSIAAIRADVIDLLRGRPRRERAATPFAHR